MPAEATLNALGATQQLTPTLRDSDGVSFPLGNREWSSDDEAVATVDAAGLVTAVGNGSATITLFVNLSSAFGSFVSATAAITVEQTAATITLTVGAIEIDVAETVQLGASVEDANGHPLATPTLGWTSSDDLVARVDGSGVVTGAGPGTATITVASESLTAATSVTVLPPSSGT